MIKFWKLAIAPFAAATLCTAAVQAETTLTLTSWEPPSHPHVTHCMVPWAQNVEEATNGRVKVNILPKAVASPGATFDAIKSGVADIGYSVHGYMPGRFSLTKIVELPFAGNSSEAISIAYWRIHEKFLAKANEHEGVKVLGLFVHGPGAIHNSKGPITKVADLEGLKIRVAGGVVSDIANQLGVVGILKPAPEAYTLLSNGVADGVMFPMEAIKSFNLAELVPYTTRVPNGLYNVSFFFAMNEAKFDSLPPEDQKAIDEVSGEAFSVLCGQAWDKADQDGIEAAQKAGNAVIEASPEMVETLREKLGSLETDWIAAAGEKGVDGKEALEALRAEVDKLEQ